LLARHLPVTAENELGETALTWARKRGDNALVSFQTDPIRGKTFGFHFGSRRDFVIHLKI
jgi:hypothetical protein